MGTKEAARARLQRFRERRKSAGLTHLELYVPKAHATEIRAMVAMLMENPNLAPGPLRDTSTGRLVKVQT